MVGKHDRAKSPGLVMHSPPHMDDPGCTAHLLATNPPPPPLLWRGQTGVCKVRKMTLVSKHLPCSGKKASSGPKSWPKRPCSSPCRRCFSLRLLWAALYLLRASLAAVVKAASFPGSAPHHDKLILVVPPQQYCSIHKLSQPSRSRSWP